MSSIQVIIDSLEIIKTRTEKRLPQQGPGWIAGMAETTEMARMARTIGGWKNFFFIKKKVKKENPASRVNEKPPNLGDNWGKKLIDWLMKNFLTLAKN